MSPRRKHPLGQRPEGRANNNDRNRSDRSAITSFYVVSIIDFKFRLEKGFNSNICNRVSVYTVARILRFHIFIYSCVHVKYLMQYQICNSFHFCLILNLHQKRIHILTRSFSIIKRHEMLRLISVVITSI